MKHSSVKGTISEGEQQMWNVLLGIIIGLGIAAIVGIGCLIFLSWLVNRMSMDEAENE